MMVNENNAITFLRGINVSLEIYSNKEAILIYGVKCYNMEVYETKQGEDQKGFRESNT